MCVLIDSKIITKISINMYLISYSGRLFHGWRVSSLDPGTGECLAAPTLPDILKCPLLSLHGRQNMAKCNLWRLNVQDDGASFWVPLQAGKQDVVTKR